MEIQDNDMYIFTLQLDSRSFIVPQFFKKRVVYLYKNKDSDIEFSKKIIDYDDINSENQGLMNGLGNLYPQVSSVTFTNEDGLRISFLKGSSIIKTFKEEKIPKPIKNTITKILNYLNNYNSNN